MNRTPNTRYGSLGAGPVDRDAERLATDLAQARPAARPERAPLTRDALRRQLRRFRLVLARPRAHRPHAL